MDEGACCKGSGCTLSSNHTGCTSNAAGWHGPLHTDAERFIAERFIAERFIAERFIAA
jgi:hypothetical protein